MQPSRNRLTCRAHNRFTPSIALWQHFVAPCRPLLHQERFSSTTTELADDGVHSDTARVSPRKVGGLGRFEADSGLKDQPAVYTRPYPLRIRKPKASGAWHTKVEASIASNKKSQVVARQTSLDAPAKLLSQTRAAFEASNDYEGVVVKPMISPILLKENNLPWCLQQEELTTTGVER
jgi:non-canonical poly(A) RNA polymerase PAPD5/7